MLNIILPLSALVHSILFFIFNDLTYKPPYLSVFKLYDMGEVLALLTVIASLVFLIFSIKNKIFSQGYSLSSLFLNLFSFWVLININVVWADLHSSGWFNGLLAAAISIVSGILLLLVFALYFFSKKYPEKTTLRTVSNFVLYLFVFIIFIYNTVCAADLTDLTYKLDTIKTPVTQEDVMVQVK